MNLPSIFKRQATMKGKPHTNNAITNMQQQCSQDTFGLGIQVFKIDAKSMTNNPSGKARQNMKNFENPTAKKQMTPSSQIPKAKKVSGLLPNIRRDEQKDIFPPKTRTQSVFSRRKVQQRIVSTNKIDSIQEILLKKPVALANPKIPAQEPIKPQKTVNKVVSKTNKTTQKVPQNVENAEEIENITRMEWRSSLSDLSHFYREEEQFQKQQATKIGRKKNQEYLQESRSFVQAYIEKETYFYEAADEYEHFGIENYGERGFEHLNYQNFILE